VRSGNWKNTGQEFEHELELTFAGYHNLRRATVRKVSPPTRTFGGGKIVYLPNPFLDYIGSWTERNGRALIVEAKSTLEPRLKFGPGGLTDTQLGSFRVWSAAQAECCLIWRAGRTVWVFTAAEILRAVESGKRSIAAKDGHPVPPGQGLILWDFLTVLPFTSFLHKNQR
jgi:hypothetical protein